MESLRPNIERTVIRGKYFEYADKEDSNRSIVKIYSLKSTDRKYRTRHLGAPPRDVSDIFISKRCARLFFFGQRAKIYGIIIGLIAKLVIEEILLAQDRGKALLLHSEQLQKPVVRENLLQTTDDRNIPLVHSRLILSAIRNAHLVSRFDAVFRGGTHFLQSSRH